MNRIPKFSLLKAFEAAARHQSFTQAANELHLTQSAISHQIRELEDHFGKKLFTRKNRVVETTIEGARLQKSLRRVFEALETACDEVGLTATSQILNLYSAPSFAGKWLAPQMAEFMKDHPEITIKLSTGAEPLDLHRAQDIDMAITYAIAPNRPGLRVTSLGKEATIPLCSPELLKGKTASQIMMENPLIESQLSHSTWSAWFEMNGLKMPAKAKLSFDRAAIAISAAVDGMGIVLESERLAERELNRGELVEVGPTVFKRQSVETHFLVCREDEIRQPKVKLFREWLLNKCNIQLDA